MNQIREKMNEIGGYFQQLLPPTSSYNQKTKPGRQRLQRTRKGYEVIGYDVYGSVHVDTETNSYNQKTRQGRQRLQRKEKKWPGSEVIGDNVQCSILANKEKKFKDIPGNIPNPGSSSKVKAKENLDDKKETLLGSMISNVSISEGSEVIGDNFHVAEIKSKDLIKTAKGTNAFNYTINHFFSLVCSYNQKTRPGRRRLHRNGKAWPGDELTGDNVYVSIHVGTEVKLNDTSSYNQNTRPGRQRLHRKEKLLAGSKVVGDSVRGSVLTAKEKKRKNETFDAKTSVVSSEESDEMIGNAVPGPVLMIQDDMLKPETSEDKAKEIVEDNKDDIRITESRSEDKVKETVGGRKETLDVKSPIISCEESKVASDGVHGSVLMIQDDIPKVRIKQKEFVDDNKDDIPNPGSNIEDKAKTVDDKKEIIHPITSNFSSEGYKIQDNIEKELSSERRKMDITFVLPARCISYIISLTTPRDASRLSLACPAFKSAADSDSVWEKFLPSDYKEIISNSSSISASSLMITSLSKKDLYFYLCHNPILINNHTTSFSLVQETGKKCYMVGARGLSIAWGDSPQYWNWLSLQESRFPEVAKLREVWWFEIIARIETRILSSKTNYGAYLVFKFVKSRQGFDARPIEFDVYFEGSNNHKRRSALLDPPTNVSPQLSQDRGDGWTEIEMGEFFNENGDDGTVVCKLCESGSVQKRGIIIQGIELRPKYGK
ncbi:uncharacterized protein LOC107174909 isoform X5 [Citrus sinensis]|uniref:uncharacterized protein LOC107174909 isoform X5 n=1 Tax=Citrus sinensis TaxID=2711 RepID=UPI0022786D65|nr:uncharacterized protein LOC107174909 isoform X5 [Citrus sinensis]